MTKMPFVFQQPPLKASRVLTDGSKEQAIVYIMESSGGMVAGDRNKIELELGQDSNVKMIQQSALKIYPSTNGKMCIQTIDVNIEEEARLEWMPEVIIPFGDANFEMTTSINMRSSSTIIWAEIIAPGREKRGEIFDFESFRSRFSLRVDDALLALDSLAFKPKEMNLQALGMLENAQYIGSIWIVSPNVHKLDLREIQQSVINNTNIKFGATRLDDNAIHCRFLSVDQWEMQEELKRVFALFSEQLT
ncbi:urease accessory protein UreD [Sporosarcina sp. CAU 1771]